MRKKEGMYKIKRILLITIFIIMLAMMANYNNAVNGVVVEQERVISETTILRWDNKLLSYGMLTADFDTIYTNARYKVEHYIETEEGAYIIVEEDTETKTGIVDEEAEFSPNTYHGYIYNEELTTPDNKVIIYDGSLVIKLYYDKIRDLEYIVEHHYEDREDLYKEDKYSGKEYEELVTEDDIEIRNEDRICLW